MPLPGQANNGLGINSFSGPMGEKEPAYGALENLKVLTALAPVGSPAAMNAPKRAKRAAVRGRTAGQAAAPKGSGSPAPPPIAPPAPDPYAMQMTAFWHQLAADPNASPLVRQYAAAATNG